MEESAFQASAADFERWHPGIKPLIDEYRSGKAPSSLLVTGAEGTGKKALALLLAQVLLCTSGLAKPCGRCPACLQIKAGSYPNLILLSCSPNEKTLKIEALRKLLSALSTHSMMSGKRVVLILDADKLTPNAQNALLKALEEPDANTHFILSSSKERALLPTVKSRCRNQILGVWPKASIRELLSRNHASLPELEQISLLASGRPEYALNLLRNKETQAAEELYKKSFLALRDLSQVPEISLLLKDSRELSSLLLKRLEEDLITCITKKETAVRLKHPWASADLTPLGHVLEALILARQQVNANVSWQAVADSLLLTISEEIFQCRL